MNFKLTKLFNKTGGNLIKGRINMAKANSLEETERLLLSLDDLLDEEINATKDSKDNANKVDDNIITNMPISDIIRKEFDQLLIAAIDDALASLGEAVKNSIYLHLQKDFNIKRNEIPLKISEFSDIIHKIFGLGASRLEVNCIKNLNEKINVRINIPEYKWPMSKWIINDFTFQEYVIKARESFETQRHSKIHQLPK
jgi:hypothetical protein